MGTVNEAVEAYIQDLRERGNDKLANKIDDAYTEMHEPKAQAVVDAIMVDGLDTKEVVNLFVMSILK